MLTSKGASGVTGAGFVVLAGTLAAADARLVPGLAIVFGIDKFMSECRALTNIVGNGVATSSSPGGRASSTATRCAPCSPEPTRRPRPNWRRRRNRS